MTDEVNLLPVSSFPSTSSVPHDTDEIEDCLLDAISHSLEAMSIASLPNCKKFRGVLQVEAQHAPNHLTATTLAGTGKISVQPYVFTCDDAGQLLVFYHLGSKLAGHAGICHGGVVAITLDECMGRACFPGLPRRIAVTAKLEINYRAPIPSDSVVMVKAETRKVEGRKAWVEATVEDPWKKIVFVDASALFIEPNGVAAAGMSKVM
jgi:acyl-coenzyme A thioesterase PaaI-like protein